MPPARHTVPDRAQDLALAAADRLMGGAGTAFAHLSPPARYRLADMLSAPFARALLRRRPLIARNFAIALGLPADAPRARRLARASVRNFGRMAADFLVVRSLDDARVRAWVRPVGEQYFDDAIGAGRGAVIVTPHLGNWDVGAVFAQSYHPPLTIITDSDWTARLVAGARTGRGLIPVPRDVALRPLYRALARNTCVAMGADIAAPGLPSVRVPFFGRPAPFPIGPARMAHRTGAALLVVTCVRLPDHTYRVEVQPPVDVASALPAERAVPAVTAALAARFEAAIRAHPDQWYPFHDVWA